jgi:hypothetical protein
MLRSPRARTVLLVLVLGAQFGLLVWHGSLDPAPQVGDYPDEADLVVDYDRYAGDRVTVAGTVVGTSPPVVELRSGGDSIRVTVRDLSVPAERGDRLRVYGVAESGRTVRAISAFTVPRWGLWYTYAVSFVAGLWVLGRLVRHWRIDREAVGLAPREVDDDA